MYANVLCEIPEANHMYVKLEQARLIKLKIKCDSVINESNQKLEASSASMK